MPGVSLTASPQRSHKRFAQSSEPNIRIVIKELKKKGRQFVIGLISVAAAGLVVVGCGADSGGDYGGQHPDYAKALAGAPAPLAALYKEGDKLLPGGSSAFEKRIAALKGYPVVVNIWASWCGPCRFEFPTLQKVSAAYGKKVAFLGVNSQDSNAGAETFLEEAPLPYPSFSDGNQDIANTIGTGSGLPDTAFYDRSGSLCYLKIGVFPKQSELAASIKRYALREECESG
jgi:cytochrome c biogenesis protein CcmG, thiol:disulfide interchange protein DsbE